MAKMEDEIKVNILDKNIQALADNRKITQIFYNKEIGFAEYLELVQKTIQYRDSKGDLKQVDFVLHSPGGDAHCAFKIIKYLHTIFGKVNIIAPFWAKSAATLLSLGGDEIILNEFSDLGPLDTQLVKEMDDRPRLFQDSALNVESTLEGLEERSRSLHLSVFQDVYGSDKVHINKTEMSKQIFDFVSKLYKPLLDKIDPFKIGENNRKLFIAENYSNDLLSKYHSNIPEKEKKAFVRFIVRSCPDHSYVIDYDRMHYFFNFVKKSKEIGDKYCTLLEKISLYLMAYDVPESIKFYIPTNKDAVNNKNENESAISDEIGQSKIGLDNTGTKIDKDKIQKKSKTKKNIRVNHDQEKAK